MPDFEKLLGELSERFHKILTSLTAEKILAKEGPKLPTRLYEKIQGDILPDKDLEKLAADGFEACVYALHEMGAPGVTIHHCNPSEEPSPREQEEDDELRNEYNKDT